jgi:hypothetical protein
MLKVKSFGIDKLTFAPAALFVYLVSSNAIEQTT